MSRLKKTNRINKSKRNGRRYQKGQVLVIVVFAFTALVAIIGLVVDLGLVFIQYGRLRRAVDAAALAASLQYREGYTIDSLESAAEQFLNLNGIEGVSAIVTVCDHDGDMDTDAAGEELALCDSNISGNKNGVIEPDLGELRKFVHVIARSEARLAFLTVLPGFPKTVPLAAEAISEAASLDVVLVIDRSETMTNEAGIYTKERDPRYCNAVVVEAGWYGDCHAFHEVKKAAYEFVRDNLFFPYDRVAIITFDKHVHTGDDLAAGDPGRRGLHLTSDRNQILTRIRELTVFDPYWNVPGDDNAVLADYEATAHLGGCIDYSLGDDVPSEFSGGSVPCRHYRTDFMFQQYSCLNITNAECTTSNIGGALLEAGTEFAITGNSRPEALWVVILIADGLANSSVDIGNGTQQNIHCPNQNQSPYCNDGHPEIRHCLDNAPENAQCLAAGGEVDEANYDSDDFARDMADFVGTGQQSLIFTIGLSNLVRNCTSCEKVVIDSVAGSVDTGEQFLKYAAAVGNGRYFYSPSGDDLRDIFREIADNIAVRLTH